MLYGIGNQADKLVVIGYQALYFAFMLVDVTFFAFILEALWVMQKNSVLQQEDKEVKNASCIVLLTAATYFIRLTFPPVSSGIVRGLTHNKQIEASFRLAVTPLLHVYGWVNFIVYGLISKAYRNEVKRLLALLAIKSKVGPEVSL